MAPLPLPTTESKDEEKDGKDGKDEKKDLQKLVIDQNNWHDIKLLGVKE